MNIPKIFEKIQTQIALLAGLPQRLEDIQQSLGRIERRQTRGRVENLHDAEFKVFSQWGEDGIIQYLLSRIPILSKTFVEFGVGDYSESNTRFLLKDANWTGLVIDGSAESINKIKLDRLSCQHDLRSEHSFITRDNINQLITKNGISGDIGLLSVDIDGNDYWVWKAIDCIQPRIVICEYNSLLGNSSKVTSLYSDDFQIFNAHYSGLYWGASIAGFDHLAREKGYSLVGSNSAGNNIFFVRDDVLGDLTIFTPQEAFVESKFRISRDEKGELSYLDRACGLKLIGDQDLYEVDTGKAIKVKDLNL
jgi:hypothetical protein